MDEIQLGSWVLEIDVNQTKKFYDKYHLITEGCDCDICTNYVLACEKFHPEIKKLFSSLGIDPRKEGEVYELSVNKDGNHLYGAFYHIVGRIIEGPKLWVPTMEGSEGLSPNFVKHNAVEIGFSEDLALVPKGFPTPTIQFEIQINVPWLLS